MKVKVGSRKSVSLKERNILGSIDLKTCRLTEGENSIVTLFSNSYLDMLRSVNSTVPSYEHVLIAVVLST